MGNIRLETGEGSQEEGYRRWETGERRRETGDRRQEVGDRRQETEGGRQTQETDTRDRRQKKEMGDGSLMLYPKNLLVGKFLSTLIANRKYKLTVAA